MQRTSRRWLKLVGLWYSSRIRSGRESHQGLILGSIGLDQIASDWIGSNHLAFMGCVHFLGKRPTNASLCPAAAVNGWSIVDLGGKRCKLRVQQVPHLSKHRHGQTDKD